MGTITPITRTSAATQATPTAAATASKSTIPAMAVNIKSVKLKDVSSFLFEQLIEGEICRFGDGWITRCPECQNLIATSSEFKTFGMRNKETWRLAPSLSCPNTECSWHRSVVIEPEEKVDISEEEEPIEENEKSEGNEEPEEGCIL